MIDNGEVESTQKIEPTANAKRLQLKSWTCRDCGSRHSRKHDAAQHWDNKHGRKPS
jgi:hypothetical protein